MHNERHNFREEHCKREKSHSLDCAYLKLKGKPEKEWTVADFYGLAVARQVTLAVEYPFDCCYPL